MLMNGLADHIPATRPTATLKCLQHVQINSKPTQRIANVGRSSGRSRSNDTLAREGVPSRNDSLVQIRMRLSEWNWIIRVKKVSSDRKCCCTIFNIPECSSIGLQNIFQQVDPWHVQIFHQHFQVNSKPSPKTSILEGRRGEALQMTRLFAKGCLKEMTPCCRLG